MACLGNIERHLPGLEASEYQITSDATDEYNCVAWAVGEDDRWWSHEVDDEYFWPDRAPRSEGVESYQAMFALYGFAECDNGDLERGVEKIALFADEGRFTHVARQLDSGRWTSKLGEDCDIEHELEALRSWPDTWPRYRSYRYGEVVKFMQRPRRDAEDR